MHYFSVTGACRLLLLCLTAEQLISAVKDNDIKTVKKLLDSGVDVNCRHRLGWNSLHTATINRNLKMMKLLIKNGADVDAKDEFSSAPRIGFQQDINSSRGMHR